MTLTDGKKCKTPLNCSETDLNDNFWLKGPTFAEDDWERYTATDHPFGLDWKEPGGLPWNKYNLMWDETSIGWISPLNMANWVDQNLYKYKSNMFR
jgi:hypothetical protein